MPVDSGVVLACFDQQMRRDAPPDGPGARVERADDVVRQVGGDAGWNGVLWSELDADTADAAIAAQVRHFRELGQEFEWKLYSHDRPVDLAERLRRAGFAAEPPETLMVAEVAALTTEVELPDGVDLRLITDPEAVDLVVDVHEQAFGEDGSRFRDSIRAQLAEQPDRVAVVLAVAGDVPVCAARMEMPPGTDFASLWGGGTLPTWRGRGIYRATVALRARIAAERGYRYLQVDASDQSQPILGRLGFVALSTTTPYVYEA
ncbi:GNAT family N-acetyltransferase [Actinopolymorpha pittospori]|uniref:GNAT superfamily N-acetyltransferase n=1 Tax=Actinopolymorpha pittospori TaxID=648752 RepID=A0A927RDM1_9ACTN|nr:GNAT family N-acetyltransferase [Actinopolymorpha pittospori]MBE1608295.1 GNAT superfamily N-acetyltransferase [Actinopolymorpha pittospori]